VLDANRADPGNEDYGFALLKGHQDRET